MRSFYNFCIHRMRTAAMNFNLIGITKIFLDKLKENILNIPHEDKERSTKERKIVRSCVFLG